MADKLAPPPSGWTKEKERRLKALQSELSGQLLPPPPSGRNVPPTSITGGVADYKPLTEEIALGRMKKARAVTKDRDPELIKSELEKARQEFIQTYNTNASRVLTQGGPAASMHQRAARGLKEHNYMIPENMPLEEAFKLAGKTSQGKSLQNIRDRYDSLRTGVEDVRTSMVSAGERTAMGLMNRGDKEEYLRSLPGVDKVAWDDNLGSFVVRRNGKYGLTDEKGASVGDVLEMSGPILDAFLTAVTVEGGPAAPLVKAGVKKGAKAAFTKVRNWLDKATKTTPKKAVTTGVVEGGAQFGREQLAQEVLLPKDAPQVGTGELAKQAAITGILSGVAQGGTDWAAQAGKKGIGKIARGDTADEVVRKGEKARKELGLPGLTKGERATSERPALAKAEGMLSKMPFASPLKKSYTQLYEGVANFIGKHTKGKKTLKQIDEQLDELNKPLAAREAKLATTEKVAEDAGTKLGKARTTLKESAVKDLQEEAAEGSAALMRGMEPQIMETITQKILKGADVPAAKMDANAALFFDNLAEKAGVKRDEFLNKNKELYGKVYEFPEANAPTFDISSLTDNLDNIKAGLRDADGKVISGLTDQEQGVINRLTGTLNQETGELVGGARQMQTLQDLVAFKQMLYNSVGNDAVFSGLDNKTKRDLGNSLTALIYEQAPKDSAFGKALREANKNYGEEVDKFFDYGAGKLFADNRVKREGLLGELADEVSNSGGASQMYRSLEELLGKGSKEMDQVNQGLFGNMILQSSSGSKINLETLLNSIEKMDSVDPGGLASKLGFDLSAIKDARKAVKAFSSNEVDIDALGEILHLHKMKDQGFVGRRFRTEDGYVFDEMPDGSFTDGDMVFDSLDDLRDMATMEELKLFELSPNLKVSKDYLSNVDEVRKQKSTLASDVTNYLKIGAAQNEKVADELISAFGGKEKVPSSIRKALGEVEEAGAAKYSADQSVIAQQRALDDIANDDYFAALRKGGLDGSESHKELYKKVFGVGAITPKQLKNVVKSLESAAAGTGPNAKAAQQLLKDVRTEVLRDLFEQGAKTPDILVGGKVIEKLAKGEPAAALDPVTFTYLLRDDPNYKAYLKMVLGDDYSAVDSLADALAPTARRDAMTRGLGALTGKTTYAQLAQTGLQQAGGEAEQAGRTWLIAAWLGSKGRYFETIVNAADAPQSMAKRVQRVIENPKVEFLAKAVQTMGRQGQAEIFRGLQAQYGAGDAEEIWREINKLADQYEPAFHGDLED